MKIINLSNNAVPADRAKAVGVLKKDLLTTPKIYVKWNYVFQINRTTER